MAINVVDLAAKELPADDWIIEGLLTRRNTGFLMGQPKKACKSWLLLAAAWSLSEGQPIWEIAQLKPTKPLRTVYFTQEDSEANIQERVNKHMKAAQRAGNDRIWIVPKDLNMTLDGRYDLIQKELDQVATIGAIDLVIFDPMRRLHSGDENDSTAIGRLWNRIDMIHRKYNCSVLFSHHIAKPPNDREKYDPTDPYHGRGSGDIYGGGDAFVMSVPGIMAPDGKSWRQVGVYFESKRGEPIPPARLKVRFTDGQVEFMGAI